MARGNFGERLKRERELREVSLDELTKSTRISSRFLNALENEDWQRLPGGVFGHGFVRTIARYLGLDEESLLAEYDLARSEKFPPSQEKQEERIPSPRRWASVLAGLVLLICLAGLFYLGRYGWHRYAAFRVAQPAPEGPSSAMNPSQSNNTGASVGGAAGSPADPNSPALDLSVSTSAATRVRVQGDGKLLLDAEMPAGETRHFFSEQQFEVFAGDSSNVVLELNGVALPPVGTPGLPGTKMYGKKDLRQGADGITQP